MKAVLIIIILMTSQVWASGESCSSVDYRSELGPSRDQGDLSWCYAYTSADLISQRVKQKVSATDVASTFILANPKELEKSIDPEVKNYLQENPDFYERVQKFRTDADIKYDHQNIFKEKGMKNAGGQEDAAIMLANAKGMCLEKDFPSTETKVNQFLRHVARLHATATRNKEKNSCIFYPDQKDATSPIVDPISISMTKVYEAALDHKCKRQPWPAPLIPIMTKYGDTLEEFENDVASGKIDRKQSQKNLFEKLNYALDNGRVAAVGYNAYTLMEPDEGEDNKHGDHSSVIAARRMIGGKCHYLVRNTWGKDCDTYYKKFQNRCKKGNVWVTKEELSESLYSVVYMK